MSTVRLTLPLFALCSLAPLPEAQSAEATGYIRVEQIDGLWWFINADSERFVSLGVNHIEPHLWLALLKERYPSPEAAAQTWGIRISPTYGISWKTMARRVDWTQPTDKEKADSDMVAFLYLIADQWYGIDREIILKHDPNHLILGDKNMINLDHPWVLAALKKHVDDVVVQTYNHWSDDKAIMDQVYAGTGKPILNGNGCFSFASPEQQQWGVKGFRTGAKSVTEVAKFYREMLEGMMATPYVIGWHHCGYLQQWDAAERGDSPRNENGFLDPFEKELTTWTDVIRQVNAKNQLDLDSYGGYTGIKGKATGYFHYEKIDGRHWFITPGGNVFFPVALSHLYSGESDLAAKNVYGGDSDKWLTDSFAKARAMGFNCALGSATSPERNLNGFVDVEKAEALFRENNFPYAVGVILLKHPWEFVDSETLPDIFDPAYEALIESRAKAVCPKYKDDPLVMGYYYGFGAFNKADKWVNHHLSLPANAPGRVAIVDVLIKKYGDDVDAFNKVYGTKFKSLEDLKDKETHAYAPDYERRNYPIVRQTLDPEILADFEAIIQHMCVTTRTHNASALPTVPACSTRVATRC